jgi:hypothetical protein
MELQRISVWALLLSITNVVIAQEWQPACDTYECNGFIDSDPRMLKAYCTTPQYNGATCIITRNICPSPQSCDKDECVGIIERNSGKPVCTKFPSRCPCVKTSHTCSDIPPCDVDNCSGSFNLSTGKAYCKDGCNCNAQKSTCGTPQSCKKNNCDGTYESSLGYPICRNFFKGCQCVL